MSESIKFYYEKIRGKKITGENCPGDYGLDCPVKYCVKCPNTAANCWQEDVSEENKINIEEH